MHFEMASRLFHEGGGIFRSSGYPASHGAVVAGCMPSSLCTASSPQ